MEKMKIRFEDYDIQLKEILNVGKELLAIAEDNSLYSLTKFPRDSAGQWVEVCFANYSSKAYWLYNVPSWGIFGYQKQVRVKAP